MKIGIVGCGMVGSTPAYAVLMSGIGREIPLALNAGEREGLRRSAKGLREAMASLTLS